jgi:integrase
MPKLTKRLIDATGPRASGDVFVWDEELRGFGLRVKPSGIKAFLLQYRNRSGRSRRYQLGRYGVLTVDEARQAARLALAAVARGDDPAEQRAADRAAITVAELCREYLDKAERGLILGRGTRRPKRQSTLYVDRGRIERHIIRLLGNRSVKDLTTRDLTGFLEDVTAGKTAANVRTRARGRAIVTGGSGTASRTMGLLGGILSYAVKAGYRPDNPVRGVERLADNERRVSLDADQYAALGRALARGEAMGEPWQAVQAVRLLALTGCRSGEVVGLKRAEFDARAPCLRLEKSKTGESMRPLGRPAAETLKAALARHNGAFVFPAVRASGTARKPYGGLPKAWNRIKRAKGPDGSVAEPLIAGLTLHGLRHAFANVSDDFYSEATTGAMLGHSRKRGGTTRGYIHKLDAALLAAADRVAGRIAAMMAGEAVETGEVVDLAPGAARRA